MTLSQYLFCLGRMELRKLEMEVGTLLSVVFFPGGTFSPGPAFIRPSWLTKMNAVAADWMGAEALRDLCHRRVLEHAVPRVRSTSGSTPESRGPYLLHPFPRWAWMPGELERTSALLSSLSSPEEAWGSKARKAFAGALRGTFGHADRGTTFRGEPGISVHPFDTDLQRWLEVCDELAAKHSTETVVGALREMAREPGAVVPLDPSGFRDSFYALVLRARRSRVSRGR